ncbi:MAG: DUF1302 family protein [Candidatus Binatia bacterium]
MHQAQRGWVSWWDAALTVPLLAACLTLVLSAPAVGTIRYGPLQISGNFETQNLIRHSGGDRLQFIQNRNTFRLRVDWDWLKKGKLIDRIDIPFIDRSRLFLIYRGVYDGFFDLGPTDRQHGQTRFDDLVGGRITDFSNSQLSGIKFENRLREAYIDFKLKDLPLSFRLGRQQVIWGESDMFRLMDIWNPLDITWHFQQESWDNIRVPLWLAKGLWDTGTIGPLANTFLEVVYNPFDFQPGIKPGFLPRPWALPFPNPLRTGQVQSVSAAGLNLSPVFDLEGSSLRKGDFHRNPMDASEIGLRFHGITRQGLEFTVNYLYARGRGAGAASPFAVKFDSITVPFGAAPIGVYQPDLNNPNQTFKVLPVNVRARVVHPYMHIFGATGNYFEGDYTQTVFRFETNFVLGEPYQTTLPSKQIPVKRGNTIIGTSPFNLEKRDQWAGMIGFDRPTWIRWLNRKTTWFITGQFFWNYIPGAHIDALTGNSGAGEKPYFGAVGKWISVTDPKNAGLVGRIERQQDANVAGNGDDIRQWETLMTLAATTFYRGGTVVPFIANAFDPVNDNNETLWQVDYFYSNNFIITLQQKFFFQYGSSAVSNDPWFAGGRFSRRDETGIKLTYQF